MLVEISGVFVKITYALDADIPLMRGQAGRPAARFNRPGQDALYLSPDEKSARVAIGEYVRADDPPRVLIHYEIERCNLLDLRHPEAASIYEQARQSWQDVLAKGGEPSSWDAADYIRRSGHVGLIDPSRQRPGLWHITLLRWNEIGAPSVRQLKAPTPIFLKPK
ncbi:MAG: RES family NAD+ phosphorylase [Sneathiella sp.]|nr:RES family NAD+ phosphorylase [Sneathiella sp.]